MGQGAGHRSERPRGGCALSWWSNSRRRPKTIHDLVAGSVVLYDPNNVLARWLIPLSGRTKEPDVLSAATRVLASEPEPARLVADDGSREAK